MIVKSYEIEKNISNFIKYNMFLLYGENYGLKKEIQELIILKSKEVDNSLELISIYENDVLNNQDNFYNTVYSDSLFSKKKIITVNNCSDKIFKYLQDINEKKLKNISLIIFSDILEKKSKLRNFFEKNTGTPCVPCYLDNNRDLENIIIKNMHANKIPLSRETINLLIEKSNNDRNNLKNEIEKIKSFSINKKKIELDEIKSLINFTGEYKSDILINECLCGNISQYKKILSEIYMNTVNQIFMLRILNSKIQKLLKMKEVEKKFTSIDNLINSEKPPIFWKDKPIIKKQMTIWKLNDLKEIIIKINKIELLCKKNPQISKFIFFDFFTNICKKANSYSL